VLASADLDIVARTERRNLLIAVAGGLSMVEPLIVDQIDDDILRDARAGVWPRGSKIAWWYRSTVRSVSEPLRSRRLQQQILEVDAEVNGRRGRHLRVVDGAVGIQCERHECVCAQFAVVPLHEERVVLPVVQIPDGNGCD
jgi:hypothetical protein